MAILIDNRWLQHARSGSQLSNAAKINIFEPVLEEIWQHLADELLDDENPLLFVHINEPGALAHSSGVGTVFIYYVPCLISVFLRRLTGGGECACLLVFYIIYPIN